MIKNLDFTYDHVVFGPIRGHALISTDSDVVNVHDVQVTTLTNRSGDLLHCLNEHDLKTVKLRALDHYERTKQHE